MQSARRLIHGSRLWALWTFIGRIIGFAREVLLASAFGTSAPASALVIAQTIPNLSRALVSEEVARGALLPVLSEELAAEDDGDHRAWALTRAFAAASTLILLVVSLAVALTASLTVGLIAHGNAAQGQAVELLRILVPLVVLNGAIAAASGYLVAQRRFGAAGAGAALFNLPLVLALVLVAHLTIVEAALLIVAGALFQALYQILAARRLAPRRAAVVNRAQLKMVFRLSLPVALALGAANFSGLIDIAFSSGVAAGAPAAFDKAFRVMLVPYSVFAVAVAVVAMPSLVEAALARDGRFADELLAATRLQAALLATPAVVVGVWATPIVRFVFERGAFDTSSTKLTSNALAGMAFVLPALGLSLLGTRAWLSQKRAWIPAAAGVAGMALNALLDWVLVTPLGLFGLGLATAVVHASVGVVLLVTAVPKPRRFALRFASFAARLGLVNGVAAAAAGGILWGGTSVPRVMAAIVGGVVVLALLARLFGVSEYELLFRSLSGRLFGMRSGRRQLKLRLRLHALHAYLAVILISGCAGFFVSATPLLPWSHWRQLFFEWPAFGAVWAGFSGLAVLLYFCSILLFGEARWAVPKAVVSASVALLLLGFAALQLSRVLQERGWPILSTQTVAPLTYGADAFLIGALGCFVLSLGVLLGSRVRRGDDARTVSVNQGAWASTTPVAGGLFALGMLGVLIVISTTHRVALFSQNIDAIRYSQGKGVGYASLLEYELLACACLAGAALLLGARKPLLAFLVAASVVSLVVFRADRTPIVFVVLMLGFVRAFSGHRFRRAGAVVIPVVLALAVAGLGVARLQSSAGPVTRQQAIARSLFDVAPEFREQAYVYHLFPQEAPFFGWRSVQEALSSVFPSGVLRVAGINKQTVYGDNSHDYVRVMNALGLYRVTKPLRTGLIGELWTDFGLPGALTGLFLFGVLVSLLRFRPTSSAVSVVRQAMTASLLVFALVTPIAALLPLALMLLLPMSLIDALVSASARSPGGEAVRSTAREAAIA
jgi:putative peptidoglycan lipid II flippase